jgi:hypothetical protein
MKIERKIAYVITVTEASYKQLESLVNLPPRGSCYDMRLLSGIGGNGGIELLVTAEAEHEILELVHAVEDGEEFPPRADGYRLGTLILGKEFR